MDKQEVFDHVARHLFAQGRPAKDKRGGCAYRGKRGTACAVGCLIRDDEYVPAMDSEEMLSHLPGYKSWSGTSVIGLGNAGLLPERLKTHVPLLSELQDVHDSQVRLTERGRFSRPSLRECLQTVATEYGLDASILKTL